MLKKLFLLVSGPRGVWMAESKDLIVPNVPYVLYATSSLDSSRCQIGRRR